MAILLANSFVETHLDAVEFFPSLPYGRRGLLAFSQEVLDDSTALNVIFAALECIIEVVYFPLELGNGVGCFVVESKSYFGLGVSPFAFGKHCPLAEYDVACNAKEHDNCSNSIVKEFLKELQ